MASEKPTDPKDDETERPRAILTKGGTVSVPERKEDEETKELPPRDEDKQEEKASELETKGGDDEEEEPEPAEVSIHDWLEGNQHPMELLPLFEKHGMEFLSDFGRISQAVFDEIISSVDIPDEVNMGRFVKDVMNYRNVFVLHGSFEPAETKRDKTPPVALEKDKKDKGNWKLGYLGLYKCVIMDYLFHKRIGDAPTVNVVEVEESKQYNAAVAITVPDINDPALKTSRCIITGLAFGETALQAEFNAFKDLFDKIVVGHGYIDSQTFHGLIRKYRTYKYIYQRSRRSNDEVWLYFWGFRRHRSATEYEKAKYFFQKNIADAIGGKKKWIPLRIEKQGVWFDGFYYLFREEIEGNREIYDRIVLQQTELIFLWMRSYNSRMEFFGNVMKFGLETALKSLSLRE
eukprot:150296_1